jgi:hypothetical protein
MAGAPLSDDDGRRLAKGVGPARGDVVRVASLTPLPRETARRRTPSSPKSCASPVRLVRLVRLVR